MSDRLTDEELAWIRRMCTRDDVNTDDLIELTSYTLRAVAELRERRAADLSPDEHEALWSARKLASVWLEGEKPDTRAGCIRQTSEAVVKCKHERYLHTQATMTFAAEPLVRQVEIRVCNDCGTWLPLGPSSDDSEAVRIEMRAAELVATHDDRLTYYTIPEYWGWQFHERSHEMDAVDGAQLAGYLARQIATHGGDE